MSVKIERCDAVALAEDLGLKTAEKYNNKKLARKLVENATERDEKEMMEELGGDGKKVLKKLLKAIEDETKFLVTGEAEESDDDEKPARSKNKKSKADEDDDDDEDNGKKKKKGKKGKKGGKSNFDSDRSRPGVVATIVECLESASKNSPTTLEKILKHLVKKFPDREEKGMKHTAYVQCCNEDYGLAKKGVKVKGSKEKGFWI